MTAKHGDDVVDLGSRLELFVDRYLIDRMDGVELRLHRPQPAEVALRFDRPWEGPFTAYATILHDDRGYHLYYRGWATPDVNGFVCVCYAHSEDGKTFVRPDLGLHVYDGDRRNNIIMLNEPAVANLSPFIDTKPGTPDDERFKALGGNETSGLLAFASADGLRWRSMQDKPVLTRGAFDSQNVSFWSEHEGCYVVYYRTWSDAPDEDMTRDLGRRTISRATSDDFLHWTAGTRMRFGDTPPEQLYTNQTHPYFRAPHIYIALPKRFIADRGVLSEDEAKAMGVHPTQTAGLSDAMFMTSRGGDSYDRTFMEAFIPPGRELSQWIARSALSALNVLPTADDQMSLYYQRRWASDEAHLRRYTLRTDGFVSATASYAGGELLTRPVTFEGGRLILNFATSAAGSVRVELQDAAGGPLPGFTRDEATPMFGDHIRRAAAWGERTDVSSLSGRPVRVCFVMQDADLFSLRFEK